VADELQELIDRVRVSTRRGIVEITWEERQELVARLRRADEARSLVATFVAAGTSRPVEVTADEEIVPVAVLDDWSQEVSALELPSRIESLRRAVHADERPKQ